MHLNFPIVSDDIHISNYHSNKWTLDFDKSNFSGQVWKNSWSKLGSDQNFGSVRQKFCRTYAEFFSIQFHTHLQYTGKKRTDYAILCNRSFSQSHHNATIHISTITFYVLKLSACCGEGFYIHALILYIVSAKLCMLLLRLRFLETWHFMFLILPNRAIAAIVLSALIN